MEQQNCLHIYELHHHRLILIYKKMNEKMLNEESGYELVKQLALNSLNNSMHVRLSMKITSLLLITELLVVILRLYFLSIHMQN